MHVELLVLISREEGGMCEVRLLHTEGVVTPFMSSSVNWLLMAATLLIKKEVPAVMLMRVVVAEV